MDGGALKLPLGAASENWPDDINAAIRDAGIGGSQLTLDLASLDPMMKRGKIAFSWKDLRSTVQPPAADSLGAAHDAVMVEIPLKLVIPHFMAIAKAPSDRKRVNVDESIPDVFSREDIAAKTAPQPAAPESAAAVPAVHPAPAPAPAAAAVSKGKAPAEIVAQICQLPGVTGALLTMSDGLPMAKQLPPSINGDALSGFVPEIFNRTAQYLKESQLGDVSTVEVQAGAHTLNIRKSGAAYIAALGNTGATLPSGKLAQIANEAARDNQ